MSAPMQETLARPVVLQGVGLHTGEHGCVTFRPAPENTGVRFVRTDLPGSPAVDVRPENATFDPLAGRRTILQQDGVQVHSMEHVLATLAGLGLDNLVIETDHMEIPEFGDGSAAPIAEALLAGGLEAQTKPKRHVKVTKPVRWCQGEVTLLAEPFNGCRLSFTIVYDHPLVGTQSLTLDVDRETFLREIAPARTFVLERDIAALRSAGWIKGGRIESAVVIGEDRILNPPLRFPDEFVRHKLLDLLGDLFLLGGPVLGHVTGVRSGHEGHIAFVKRLKETLPLPGRRAGGPADEWDVTAILDLLPHRYPFLLVDRITSLEEGRSIEGLKNVTINEPFFQGHFPGHPIMPAVLILEAMAQVGGLLLLHSVDDPNDKLMYFMGIDGAKFRRPVTPGDRMHLKLTLLKLKNRISKMRGEAYVDEQLVAEAELMATVVDRRPA